MSKAIWRSTPKLHKRSWREDERLLRREILPRWRNRKARDIKRRDVLELLDTIVERGAPIQANRVLALVRKMFNWGISRDILQANPCAQVKPPAKEQPRQRVLTEAEIRAVWVAFEQLGPVLGSVFKLRILTAQRGGEIQSMRWSDIELSTSWWTIPPPPRELPKTSSRIAFHSRRLLATSFTDYGKLRVTENGYSRAQLVQGDTL